MHFDIKNIAANQIGIPGLLLNEEGKIIFFNSEASAILKDIKQNDEFAPLLAKENREKFLNSLSKIRSLNLPDKFNSTLTNLNEDKEFNFDLTPVYDGTERVILATFRSLSKPHSISLTGEEESLVGKNRQLSKVISFIRANYPFTLVDKINLQKEMDELDQIFFIKYPDGKFIAVNKFFSEMIEIPSEKISGKKDIDFLPRSRHYLYEAVRSFIKKSGASIVLDENFLPGVAAGTRMLELPIKNIDDEVVAIVSFSYMAEDKSEISKTKHPQDETLDKLLEIIPNPAVIYDASTFQILNSNELAEDLYNYSKLEFREVEVTDLYLPEEVQSLIENSVAGEKNYYNGIYHHKTNKGENVRVEIRRSRIIYNEKEAFLVFIHPVNIVNNKTENEEEEYSDELEKFNPALLSQVFHEILNPLNIIVGFSQELARGISEPTEEQSESIRLINSNHRRLMQRIDDVMEYSILREEEVELKKEKINLPDFISKFKKGLEPYLSSIEKKLIESKISDSLPVVTDAVKLRAFLKSLIKTLFSLTGEERIYISAYKFNDENFLIGIKNNSLNISNGFTKKISSIFVEENYNESGVSIFTISLLRKMLKLLSGSVQLVTKNGEPMEFGILFPLRLDKESEKFEPEFVFSEEKEEPFDLKTNEAPESIQEKINKEKEGPQDKEKTVEEVKGNIEVEEPEDIIELDISGLSCLYIEDETDSQMLFGKKLNDLKKIDYSFELETAIKLIQENEYDFIVVDINLEGEYNGLDALRIINRLPGKEDIPVIATTAYEIQGDQEKYIAAGFTEYISKPITRENLISILKRIQF